MTKEFVDALDALIRELTLAFSAPPATERDDEPRDRYVFALVRIARFLKNVGVSEAHCDPFVELAGALYDLGMGRTEPLLSPAKTETRVPDSTQDWIIRAVVCLGLIGLAAAGKTRKKAAESIAKEHRYLEERLTKNRTNKAKFEDTILNWAEQFDSDEVKNPIAQCFYRDRNEAVRSWISGLPESQRLSSAKKYLTDTLFRITPPPTYSEGR